jgi:hypothetical protein
MNQFFLNLTVSLSLSLGFRVLANNQNQYNWFFILGTESNSSTVLGFQFLVIVPILDKIVESGCFLLLSLLFLLLIVQLVWFKVWIGWL